MRLAVLALIAALTALVALPGAAPAAAAPWVMDKAHASVTFRGNHLGFSMVYGVFREFDAEIDFDPANVPATRVRFVIQAASVDTLWPARDESLRSREMLDAANFPEIVFVSTAVRQTGEQTAEIDGELTIKGITRPVTFQARLRKIGPSPFDPNKTVAGFHVSGTIIRTDFGVSFAAPAIGIEIPFEVDIEMSPAS